MKNEKKTLASCIRDNSLYDLSSITELLAYFATPKECSQILRDHHESLYINILQAFLLTRVRIRV